MFYFQIGIFFVNLLFAAYHAEAGSNAGLVFHSGMVALSLVFMNIIAKEEK